jgi:GH24 family phage-related lysozyme (muramidase)
MTTTVAAAEIEIIKTFEGYSLARYQGNLGIWSVSKEVDWDATFATENDIIYTGNMEATLMDDDCNHLLEAEWEGLFECRVQDLISEGNYLASLEV